MANNQDQILQGIVFIPIEKGGKRGGARTRLFKDIVSIRRRNEGESHTNTIRFSPALVEDLLPYDSMRIAKNTLTGDLYFVFFKDGKGDAPLRFERHRGGNGDKNEYPLVNGKQILNALLKEMGESEDNVSFKVRISENLSNDDSFYTVMIKDRI